MKEQRPDQHTVLDAIALANRAPSVHNTQPWRWLLGNESIHLIADHTRRLPATDVNGHDMLLSCGAALHHLRVALAALGWHANVRHLPNPNDPDHLAAVTTIPRTPSTKDIALAGAVARRRTDRRRFSSWPVPDGHLDLMAERAARAGALLLPVTDERIRGRLTRAIDEAAGLQRTDAGYGAELATWSGRGRVSEDGVLAASTLAGPRTHGDTTMRAFPTGTLADTETGREEDDGGELLVLATITDDLVSVLRAGEAASAALLAATDVGLATCPLSQALELPGTRALIRDQVFDGAAFPHLILRTGWAPTAAPRPPRSPRRATAGTVDYLPGTPHPPRTP
jgi:nitroreductase